MAEIRANREGKAQEPVDTGENFLRVVKRLLKTPPKPHAETMAEAKLGGRASKSAKKTRKSGLPD